MEPYDMKVFDEAYDQHSQKNTVYRVNDNWGDFACFDLNCLKRMFDVSILVLTIQGFVSD